MSQNVAIIGVNAIPVAKHQTVASDRSRRLSMKLWLESSERL